ncbi:MAG TPA: DUF427 domain-containing protein [Acidimicrobiales bacterium]
MTLNLGPGPLGPNPAGRFEPALPEGGVTYVEPFYKRVRGIVGGTALVDTYGALMVHRPGKMPFLAFPESDVTGIETRPVAEAPGHVRVAWDAFDRWLEEDDEIVGHFRNPYHRVDVLHSSRRLRVMLGDEVLVDTTHTLALFETGLRPRLYVDRSLVRMDLLVPSGTHSFCAYKGSASYWHAVVDGVTHTDVAWSYDDPLGESAWIAGMLSFDGDRITVEAEVPSLSRAEQT